MFPGKFLHIGADETFELGRGQTGPDVKQRGLGAVYIEFLNKIHATLAPLDWRLLFWGDVAMNDPELVKTMPKDMIAVAWHYNPQDQGFEKWLRPFLDAKMETWVAPGVNNWNRVYPNNDWALRNIQQFTAEGQKFGSTGQLNTVWNDDGEGLFNLDWYGVVFGAAAAWQPGTSDISQFQKDYAPVFHGDASGALGQAQQELMEVHKVIARVKLGDAANSLFWVDPWSLEGQETAQKIRPVLGEIRRHTEKSADADRECEAEWESARARRRCGAGARGAQDGLHRAEVPAERRDRGGLQQCLRGAEGSGVEQRDGTGAGGDQRSEWTVPGPAKRVWIFARHVPRRVAERESSILVEQCAGEVRHCAADVDHARRAVQQGEDGSGGRRRLCPRRRKWDCRREQ